MNLTETMNWRYVVKQFDKNKKVSKERLDKILNITNLSPISNGLQPYEIVIVSNQSIKEQLVQYSYRQTNVSDLSHLIIFAARTDINDKYQYYKKVRKPLNEMIVEIN